MLPWFWGNFRWLNLLQIKLAEQDWNCLFIGKCQNESFTSSKMCQNFTVTIYFSSTEAKSNYIVILKINWGLERLCDVMFWILQDWCGMKSKLNDSCLVVDYVIIWMRTGFFVVLCLWLQFLQCLQFIKFLTLIFLGASFLALKSSHYCENQPALESAKIILGKVTWLCLEYYKGMLLTFLYKQYFYKQHQTEIWFEITV